MNRWHATAALGVLCIAAGSQASLMETFNLGPLNSDGTAAAPAAGTTANFNSIGGYNLRRINLAGTATKVNSGDFGSEARFRMTAPNAAFVDISGLGGPGSATWTTFSYDVNVMPSAFWGMNPAGSWSMRAFESFNDSGIDKTHDPLTVKFYDDAPAPSATNLGALNVGTSPLVSGNFFFTGAGQSHWFTFSLTSVISNGNGTFVDIQSLRADTAADPDTYIGLWDANGTLIASDDDEGYGLLSAMSFGLVAPTRGLDTTNQGALTAGVDHNGRDGSLAAGTYYLGVARWASGITLGNGFIFTGGGSAINTGAFVRLTSNAPVPEPASLAVLGLGALALMRRRRKV